MTIDFSRVSPGGRYALMTQLIEYCNREIRTLTPTLKNYHPDSKALKEMQGWVAAYAEVSQAAKDILKTT